MRVDVVKDRLEKIMDLLLDLQEEVESTRDDIEPYEGKDDLTDAQQERYDWLDEVADAIDSARGELEDYAY